MTSIQRRAADRLAAGTTIVAKRIGAALVPEGRPIATTIRCGGTLWAAPRMLDLAHQAPILLAAGTGLWCWAAWRAEDAPKPAPEQAKTTTPAAPATAPEDDGEWIQDSPDEAILWALIRHTAGLTKQGTAAHLQAILEEARKRGEMTDWTVSDLAEELASYKVPVVEQKKLTIGDRQYNRAAVLLTDLPEADPAPVPAIVQAAPPAAAQSAA